MSTPGRQPAPDHLQNVSHGPFGFGVDSHSRGDADDVRSNGYDGDLSMVGGGYGGCLPTASSRRMREFIPESKKDDEYWMKRQKNNEAAKRSREKRRANDAIMARRIHELTTENKRLKLELIAIRRQFGLVPGTYVMPSDGPASSSDDGLSSPQPCSSSSHELTVSAPPGGDSNVPPLVSCRQVACPADAEYGHHRRLECATSGQDVRQVPLGATAAFSCAKLSYGGAQHHNSYSSSLLHVSAGSSGAGMATDGLVDYGKSNGLEPNGGSSVASLVYDDDRIIPAGSSRHRLTSATFDSRRSNDAFLNVFSDVSSSDDSDSFDGSSQEISPSSYATIASRHRDLDVSNGVRCRNPAAGETPLNLSAAPARMAASAVHMHASKHVSKLWSSTSASPDVVEPVVAAGVDLSIPPTLPPFRDTRSETIPPLLPVPKSVSDVKSLTAVTCAKFETSSPDVAVGDVVPSCGGDSAANRSMSLPSLSASHGSVTAPATGASETKWTQQAQCQPQEDVLAGVSSRQVRRGFPLKVWHKLAALRAEDGDADPSPGPDDDRSDDISVSKRPCIFERRSLSVDCSSYHVTSQDVVNQAPTVASAASAYDAMVGLGNEQELIETKRLLRFDREDHAGRLDHPVRICGNGFPSSSPLGDSRLPAPASSINDHSHT